MIVWARRVFLVCLGGFVACVILLAWEALDEPTVPTHVDPSTSPRPLGSR